MARTTRITAEQIATALAQAEGDVSAAASALGCDRSWIYKMKKDHEVVSEAYDTFRPVMLECAKSNMIAILRDRTHPKNYDASKFVLETLGKNEGFAVRHEVTGADGGGLVVEFVPTDA